MPGIRNEYLRISGGGGWIARAGRGRLRLEGADVRAFLQALVTNDVSGLAPGAGVYAAYLTPTGRMISDLEIYHRDSGWLLDVTAERAAIVADKLDQSVFSEDVRVLDVSADLAEIAVIGGEAVAGLADALGVSADRLTNLAELAQTDWEHGFVARGGEARLPAFVVFVPAAEERGLVGRLEAAGIGPMSAELAESLRVDAGRPHFGTDMTEETIPLEAGLLDRAISTTKGCYVGQEIVIRILHRGGGRVARRLVTLAFATPAAGRPAAATALTSDGKVVGHLTSVAESPTSSAVIALGYVHRDLAETGREVSVGDTGVVATVTGMAG